MSTQRTIEIFSTGCAACEDTIALVNRMVLLVLHSERAGHARPTGGGPRQSFGRALRSRRRRRRSIGQLLHSARTGRGQLARCRAVGQSR